MFNALYLGGGAILVALLLGLGFSEESETASLNRLNLLNTEEVHFETELSLIDEEKEIAQKTSQKCHPSYSGCLNPNASDYDCAGGSGNGPYYTGPVQVFGYDEYDLDRDNNGWGCE